MRPCTHCGRNLVAHRGVLVCLRCDWGANMLLVASMRGEDVPGLVLYDWASEPDL